VKLVIGLLALGGAALWLRQEEERRQWRWQKLSLEARLREAQTRGEVFERALAKMRADERAGKLLINDDYRSLFERLTAEAKGPAEAEG